MKSLFRPFPLPLTRKQWFYLCVLQGVGAGIIDGGANFGIAYAMYHAQPTVKMWVFSQNTIAGDLGVTPIIQCLASMIITSTLVHTDLHHHAIRPLPFVYPHVEDLPDPRSLFRRRPARSTDEKRHGPPINPTAVDDDYTDEGQKGLAYYYWMLVRFIFEGTEKNMLLARIPILSWFGRLAWTAAQGAAIGVVFGFPIWCLAVVILGPIYGTGNMGSKWAPQVIKGVYGAIVGWITNPVIAALALGSQADCHLLVVENANEGGLAEQGEGAGVETINEDEEFQPPPSTRRPSHIPSTRRQSIVGPPVSPSPGRSRAGSFNSTHARPPLTANVSYLSPLPPNASPLIRPTGRSRRSSTANSLHSQSASLAPPLVSPLPTAIGGRARGATVSSEAESQRSFSYTLGGTGGRAQRSRAGSLQPSRTPMLGDFGQTSSAGLGRQGGDEEEAGRTPVWDVFGRRESAPGVTTVKRPVPRRMSTGREFEDIGRREGEREKEGVKKDE